MMMTMTMTTTRRDVGRRMLTIPKVISDTCSMLEITPSVRYSHLLIIALHITHPSYLVRYSFKEDANNKILPEYGNATVRSGYW